MLDIIKKKYELRIFTWMGVALRHEWHVFIHARREVQYITVNITVTPSGVIFNNDNDITGKN